MLRAVLVTLSLCVCSPACTEQEVVCPTGTSRVERGYDGRTTFDRWCVRSDGVAHGPFERFALHPSNAPDALPIMAGAFDEGLADGAWIERDPSGGFTTLESGYLRAVPEGTWRAFDETGLRWEHTWHRGIACGTWIEYTDGVVSATRELEPCDAVDAPDVVDPTLAPFIVASWDGASCPAGLTLATGDAVDPDVSACVDDSGRRQGPFVRWHPALSPESARVPAVFGQHEADRRVGRWTFVHPSGAVAARGDFSDDRENGPWESFHADRRLYEAGPYRAGLRHGRFTTFHANGARESAGEWSDGRRTGPWSRWFESGTPSAEVTYAADVLHGSYRRFHENGNLAEAGVYADGLRDGLWKTWYPDGALATEQEFEAGVQDGVYRAWAADGRPTAEGPIVGGVAHGPWTFWNWQAGERVRETGEVVDGKLEGDWIGTHEDGARAVEKVYHDGLLDGPTLAWWKSGEALWEGAYEHGDPHGRWRWWHDNGALASDVVWSFGAMWGRYRDWWPAGGPRSEGEMRDSTPVGTWTFWNEAGDATTVDYR